MNNKKVLAITSCPTGVAHTYMAAESLEKAGKEMGIDVKVETHGSIGIENGLTSEEIANAEGIIFAADTNVDKSRFVGKRIIEVKVQDGIQRPKELIQNILDGKGKVVSQSEAKTTSDDESSDNLLQVFYRSLMNGVSHMIPFVVTGGLLIAISLSLGGEATPGGIVVPEESIWNIVLTIGATAMGLIVPVLSAFIAYSIADRPGYVPGFVGGMIASNGALYGSEANAGFLGGIVAGFMAGIIANWIKGWKVPKALQSIMPIIIIPIISSLLVGFSFIYIVGKPVTALFVAFSNLLLSLQGGSQVFLAMILGAMIAVDMGGPFNKVAFLFGTGMIEQGNTAIMGAIAVAIAIPPLAMGIAPFILKNKFNQGEKETAKASFTMGLFGITEGAIPFATSDPIRVIPSIVIGSMAGSVVAMLSGVQDHVAHGGPIVAVLGAVDNILMFFIATVIGIAVAVLMLAILKRDVETTEIVEIEETVEEPQEELSKLTDIMTEDVIILDINASSKEDAIKQMSAKLEENNIIDSEAGFTQAVLNRESESTTGIGEGIAIPHGAYEGVKKASVVFARSNDGIDWASLDGEPAHLIFMIAVPTENRSDLHLKVLQKLSRSLMNDEFRSELMSADTNEKVFALLSEVE